MNSELLARLLVIVAVVALGWWAGRRRWLGPASAEPARVLSNAAFFLFAPALLFRTTARLDLSHLPWRMLLGFFVPVLALMLLVYAVERWRRQRAAGDAVPVAGPAVRAITVTFGNSVQIGIPVATALFGETGLALHLTLVSLHALVLLLLATTLVESDLARAHPGARLGPVLLTTLRNTVIHPVVLPVLAGLAWQATGLGLAEPVDEALRLLGAAVVPLCLALIGLSLAYLGLPRPLHGALGLSALKLLAQPAAVLLFARYALDLSGLPLQVMVVMACLPSGSNALMFAQRYRTLEAETTATLVLSTLLMVVNIPLWLALLSWV